MVYEAVDSFIGYCTFKTQLANREVQQATVAQINTISDEELTRSLVNLPCCGSHGLTYCCILITDDCIGSLVEHTPPELGKQPNKACYHFVFQRSTSEQDRLYMLVNGANGILNLLVLHVTSNTTSSQN